MMNIVSNDSWLEPVSDKVTERYRRYESKLKYIESKYGSLKAFASAHEFFGFTYDSFRKGWWYREWAPAAHNLFLFGDFNGWNRYDTPLERESHGIWSVFLPDSQYKKSLKHGSLLKVLVQSSIGEQERIPVFAKRVVQNEDTKDFAAQFWVDDSKCSFAGELEIEKPLFIYETHIGMAQENESVGSFNEFRINVLPRIKEAGYNAIQLMAIAEHPYYGSFGYHVSNFFAASSRFGTPEDLKMLIDEAHRNGMAVIMDLVHSHTVKNTREGLNLFDGTENQYLLASLRSSTPRSRTA